MKNGLTSPIDKICYYTIYFIWVMSIAISVLVSGLSIHYCLRGSLEFVDTIPDLFIAVVQFLGSWLLIKELKSYELPKGMISVAFWNTVQKAVPLLSLYLSLALLCTAVFAMSFIIFYVEDSWHMITHHIVSELVASKTKDLNELAGFSVSNLADTLVSIGSVFAGVVLSSVALMHLVLIPSLLKRWSRELEKTNSDISRIYILDLITITNLYLGRFQEAEKSSSQMLNTAMSKTFLS